MSAGSELPASGTPAPAAVVVENVILESTSDGLTLTVRTSVPVSRFACRLGTASSRELLFEVPDATSRLQPKIALDNPLLPEALVEKDLPNGPGVRIRIPLEAVRLIGVEQVERGMVLTFAKNGESPAASEASSHEYRVGVGDKLEIAVFGNEDLSKVVEVRGDGTINYPLIKDLQVAGKTVAEIDDEITRILAKDYLVDPQVSVDVREYQSQWVTIIGEVRTPGRYVLKRNMRLIDLLAEAGGASKEAGNEILITRRKDGKESPQQMAVDRGRLLSSDNRDANVALVPGDIVTISEQQVFYIRGEVSKPGSYYLASGMTVFKAISVAGGFSQFANRKDVELLRSGANGVTEKQAVNLKAIEDGKKQDIPLHANDTIIVPRRIF